MARCWIDGPEYDAWKTTPPEPKSSSCFCSKCKCELAEYEEYYDIEGEILCDDCAHEWLEDNKKWVTEEMAYG